MQNISMSSLPSADSMPKIVSDSSLSSSFRKKTKQDKKVLAIPASAKTKKPQKPIGYPKRPLSAYNFFFQISRDRLVVGDESLEFTQEQVDQTRNFAAPRHRSHRKTHGKIGFQELAFTIGSRWKTLDPTYKEMFVKRAQREKERYDKEVAHWKREQAKAKIPLVPSSALLLPGLTVSSSVSPITYASNQGCTVNSLTGRNILTLLHHQNMNESSFAAPIGATVTQAQPQPQQFPLHSSMQQQVFPSAPSTTAPSQPIVMLPVGCPNHTEPGMPSLVRQFPSTRMVNDVQATKMATQKMQPFYYQDLSSSLSSPGKALDISLPCSPLVVDDDLELLDHELDEIGDNRTEEGYAIFRDEDLAFLKGFPDQAPIEVLPLGL